MSKTMPRTRSLFPFGPFWDDLFQTGFGAAGKEAAPLRPALDVAESEDAITVTIELAGIARDDVSVSIEDGVLTVSGEKKAAAERTQDTFHLVERRFGSFSRTLTLPNTISADEADARFENGVLTIRLPKHERLKPRRLEIK